MQIVKEAGPTVPQPPFKEGDIVQHNEYADNIWLLVRSDGKDTFEYINVANPRLSRYTGGVFSPSKYHLFTGKIILSN